jgi:hypothetical protein
MNLRRYISNISFRAIEPRTPLGPDRRLRIARPGGADAKVVELPGAPLDVFNTVLPEAEPETRQTLAPTREMPRMSTFALGAVLNRAVAAMPADQVYVNVGVWQGFTYFAGALGNPDKRCIGVDNFSEWGKDDVRLALEDRLARIGTPGQALHTMDYREYFAKVHRDPIGVYVYDGDHAYEHQLQGLKIAEPHLADGCVVIVDDTNSRHPYEATLDFIAQSDRRWDMLLDCDTSAAGHPTWWNGLMLIQEASGGARRPGTAPIGAERLHRKRSLPGPPDFVSEAFTADRPLITLIVRNLGGDTERLGGAVEAALAQSWPALEVVVADEHPCPECQHVLGSFGDRIRTVGNNGDAVRAAVAASRGEFVGFADCDAALRPTAVEIGLAFPRAARFNTELSPERHASIEQALAAGALIAASIRPGARLLVASTEWLPHVGGLERAEVFMADGGRTASPEHAGQLVDALGEARRFGAGYMAFTPACAAWLEAFPEFRERLDACARRIVDEEQALVYEFVDPARP